MNEKERKEELSYFYSVTLLQRALFYKFVQIKYKSERETLKLESPPFKADTLKKFKDAVYFRNLFYQNDVKGENIYIKITEQTKYIGFFWLDDLDITAVPDDIAECMTVIQTSPKKFQAYFLLDRQYPIEQIRPVRDYFLEMFKADVGAKAFTQPMRLPYFYNLKPQYRDKNGAGYFIRVVQYAKKELDLTEYSHLWGDINQRQQKRGKITDIYKYYEGIKNGIARALKIDPEELDLNAVDFRFCESLIKKGLSLVETAKYLIDVRPDIDKHDIGDYVHRTVIKAYMFVNEDIKSVKELNQKISTMMRPGTTIKGILRDYMMRQDEKVVEQYKEMLKVI